MGKLRSNPNKDVARIASEIVTKWKRGVEAEKKRKGAAGTPTSSTAAAHGSPAAAAAAAKPGSPAPAAAARPPSKATYKGDPEKRRYDTDGVNVARTSSEARNKLIGMIYNGLAYRSTDPEADVLERAVEVEHAAFVAYKGITEEYKTKLRSLFQNLKNKSNRELGRRVMSGELTAERFVVMSPEDLKSAEMKKVDAALEKENMKKAQVAQIEKSISDALECGRCKQRKVSYTQAQTRSADEPMTTFCECTVCGNRWKVSCLSGTVWRALSRACADTRSSLNDAGMPVPVCCRTGSFYDRQTLHDCACCIGTVSGFRSFLGVRYAR